ncbi:MAG: protein kinase domain-containing protein [Planctomycetaceae bacterium]
MTNPDSPVDSTLIVGEDSYIHWQPVGSGPDGLAYTAIRQTDHAAVDLRVVQPIAKDKVLAEQLYRRARLINLCSTALVRRWLDIRLHTALPWVVVERPCDVTQGDRSLPTIIDDDQASDRLMIAREIVAALRVAHRIGLHHGNLVAEAVIVGSDDQIRIDFSSLNVTGDTAGSLRTPWCFASAIERGEAGDLFDLRMLLRRVLESGHADLAALTARSRAALRVLLRADGNDEASIPSLTQWETVLGSVRLAPVHDDPHGTMEVVSPASQPEITESSDRDATRVMPIGPSASGDDTQEWNTADDMVADGMGLQSPRRSLEPGSMIGRYRLDRKLGQGGMGVVFRGTDIADDSAVAVKILWADGKESPQAVRRFHKEARMLAGLQNDYVTRLYDVGEDKGVHFIAMEYIEGTTLKQWLSESGRLDERTALLVIADIARALVDAHAQGIIHRDIKPENVLLQENGEAAIGQLSKRVKLSDFGIARQIDQSASLEVTQAGALLGTPRYMSPEQCRGTKSLGPQTDVYSLGITLYELLTGGPPFTADDALKVAAMHCFDPVPAVQKKLPTVSDLTAQLVSRALAKEPENRFADAAQMLASIQRILRGEVADFEMHPKLPAHDASKLWQKTFEWHLESTPAQLWPLVSNTERLNRALGLPPVSYRTVNDHELGLRKYGPFKLSTVQVSWEEHPFEWVEGSRMGILREFDSGPFKWFMSIVELSPRPDGGTRLQHHIRIEPRNLVGKVLTTIEADWRGGKNLDRVYKRIDRAIQRTLESDGGSDPFEPAVQPKKHQRDRLAQRCERLEDQGVDSELAAKLTDFIATAPPQVVAQIRPLALAEQMDVDGERCLEACLRAAAEGLLVLRWEILCPTCRVSASAENLLSSIKEHTHCVACDYDFRSDLGEAIELVFRAHPEIRDVDEAIYCIGGPEHSPHVAAQLRLEAGERIELEIQLSAGDYLIRGPRLIGQQRLRVRSTPAPSSFEITLSELGKSDHTPVLRAGQQTLTLTNDLERLQVIRVERMIPRDDVVTATHVSTIPLFRELFPEQVMSEHRPISADEMTLLATGICGVDDLYGRLGDREAYDLIGRQLDVLRACVASHRGTVAKTVGEGILAAFLDCDHAVEAALAMQASLDEEPGLKSIRLSIAVHRGRTLVATMNQRLDYFGATARAVSALPDFAAGDLVLTESVFADPGVQSRLRTRGVASVVEPIQLPGRPSQIIQRVTIPRT